MAYSQSKLNTYRDCPLKYKFAYVDRIKTPDSIEQFVGSMVHEALQEVVDVRRKFGKTLGYDDACLIFDRKFDENLKDDIVISKEYLTADDYKVRGHDYIEKFYEIEARREPAEVLSVEKKVNFEVGPSPMIGYIDRLEKQGKVYHIIDYKASDYPMKQAKADEDWQLAIYEMAVRDEFPDADDVVLEWFYLGRGVVVQSARTPEQLRDLEGEICSLVTEIENDTDFLPLGKNWCPCEYEDLCQAEKERRRLKASEVEPPMEDVVEDYARLYAEKSELKARIKELESYLDELGERLARTCTGAGAWSVEGPEHVIEVKTKVDYPIPSKGSDVRLELEAAVRDCGFWEQMSEINKSLVLDGLKKGRFGDRTDDVRALFEEKVSHSFKVSPKPKGS